MRYTRVQIQLHFLSAGPFKHQLSQLCDTDINVQLTGMPGQQGVDLINDSY